MIAASGSYGCSLRVARGREHGEVVLVRVRVRVRVGVRVRVRVRIRDRVRARANPATGAPPPRGGTQARGQARRRVERECALCAGGLAVCVREARVEWDVEEVGPLWPQRAVGGGEKRAMESDLRDELVARQVRVEELGHVRLSEQLRVHAVHAVVREDARRRGRDPCGAGRRWASAREWAHGRAGGRRVAKLPARVAHAVARVRAQPRQQLATAGCLLLES